jgi:amino acid transporter
VLGEIGRPRKRMPIGTWISVGIVCVLYLLVNISYVGKLPDHTKVYVRLTSCLKMIVVPKESQLDPSKNVALLFFQLTFGTMFKNEDQSQRILSAFMSISSFGNIMAMAFTAARG